ncbi:MAG: hypothetical protein AVDCRST_MAG50-1124, partial [uncultured Acidimicrobiales bacterium]
WSPPRTPSSDRWASVVTTSPRPAARSSSSCSASTNLASPTTPPSRIFSRLRSACRRRSASSAA